MKRRILFDEARLAAPLCIIRRVIAQPAAPPQTWVSRCAVAAALAIGFALESRLAVWYFTDRWTKNPTNVVFFDNLVIAREYIGPTGRD